MNRRVNSRYLVYLLVVCNFKTTVYIDRLSTMKDINKYGYSRLSYYTKRS